MRKLSSVLVLCLAFALPVGIALRPSIYNPDIWCHLRTGDWILQQHAFPRTDPFAQGGSERTFLAYSWLFEVACSKLYAIFGLRFMPLATAALAAAIVLALFLLFRSIRISLTTAALLLLVTGLSISGLFYLRSWLFTMLFFVVELWLLVRPRTNTIATFIVLPLLFVLWTNIHVQFLYGLWILGLFFGEALLARIMGWNTLTGDPKWTLKNRAILLVLCSLATLVNPYAIGIYEVIREYATQAGVFPFVRELRPFSPENWASIVA